MEEIYTKPFESVQAAITLFEQKIDPKKSSSSSDKEAKGGILKDLTDSSLLLEATEHEKNLTFFKFDASSKSPEVLKRHLAGMEFLEIELLKQIIMSEYLHMELKQSKEAQCFFSKDFVKSENELMKRVDSGNDNHVLEIEKEGKRMKEELNFPWEKINGAEGAKSQQQKPFEKENEEASSIKNNAFSMLDSDGFCTGITISMEEYEFLIHKSDIANQTKSESTGEYEVKELKRELEDKNSEISELRCLLEEAERRAELAERAKMVVESQLRKWRDQRRLRRAASDAVKEYCATKNEVHRQHEKPLLSKLSCMNPEARGYPPHPKRSVSVHDGRKSKHSPLGKLLKMKF